MIVNCIYNFNKKKIAFIIVELEGSSLILVKYIQTDFMWENINVFDEIHVIGMGFSWIIMWKQTAGREVVKP